MILIADSGSTKTDWALMDNDKVIMHLRTKGMNPFQMSEVEMADEIRSSLIPLLPTMVVDYVYFYGAGCTKEKQPIIERVLRNTLNIKDSCFVYSDMLGAARAVCGHHAGIACILGTGSNSCAYDGEEITKNVSPLGFILGDEGSGAVLGKTLVGDVLKNQLPEPIIRRFHEKYQLTAADIIDRVYRQPKPNTFLASFVPFLQENLDDPSIYQMVKSSFTSFLVRNVKQYPGWDEVPIGFIGSIALVFKQPLQEALNEQGMILGRIIQAPLETLVEYHA